MKVRSYLLLSLASIVFIEAPLSADPPPGGEWRLVFADEFDYADADLDREWISQNGPSGHILSSRWRENARVENGVLKLIGKKENRGGQDWTAGNIWTKKLFKYGYFECRYKYAAATGTNNSFWLMTQGWQQIPAGKKRFEIDINEGHYPDEINVNLHNWSDFWTDEKSGKKRHGAWGKSICLSPPSGKPGRTISLDVPVRTRKIRFSTGHAEHFHLREIRLFPKNDKGYYPDIEDGKTARDSGGLENYALKAKVTAHSPLHPQHAYTRPEAAIDNDIRTSWILAPGKGKFIELDLGEEKEIGAVQFLTGWMNGGEYVHYIHDYKIEYWGNGRWEELAVQENDRLVAVDLGAGFHTYALEWNEDELIYYFDDKIIHRRKNDIAHWECPVWLSLAIMYFAGDVTDAIDGKAMTVDYVKVWQRPGLGTVRDRAAGEPLE
ncbi:family 16 glycosylhydrolase [Termitidicoccus mucosus]